MATATNLRARRNVAQLHALAGVQREIRANDSSAKRKYLREFNEAFQSYQSAITLGEMGAAIGRSDIVLIGDYHALPVSQRFAAELLEASAGKGRPIILGVETIFARDQHILDEWWRREISEDELRQRIRFDADWNYDWQPFYDLLVTAREHAEGIYGLDCMPREDLRRIGIRDRHAAHKIGQIRHKHPNALLMVLFGESHLAPAHLPQNLKQELPQERVLTVLQNVDALYWQAAGEHTQVPAVRVNDDVICAFNSTPLEKYENYRLCFKRWNCNEQESADAAPTIYNLIDSLVRFLGIDRYCSHNGTQPKFLVDMMPEVYSANSDGRLRRILLRSSGDEKKVANMLQHMEAQGSVYLPTINAFCMRQFQIAYAAEEAARFLHHACRGLPLYGSSRASAELAAADRFYVRAVEHALAYFGSRVLYPAREAVGLQNNDATEGDSEVTMQVCDKMLQAALHGDRQKFDRCARQLGYGIGTGLYDAYLRGAVSPRALRTLFLTRIDAQGAARQTCHSMLLKTRRPCASVRN